jgi:hypothetical protein
LAARGLHRRAALRTLLNAAAVFFVGPVVTCAAAAESCADSATESLRASLNYANPSPDAAKTCGGCAFFSRDESQPACGQCTIMSGQVDAGGVCDSWAARSG